MRASLLSTAIAIGLLSASAGRFSRLTEARERGQASPFRGMASLRRCGARWTERRSRPSPQGTSRPTSRTASLPALLPFLVSRFDLSYRRSARSCFASGRRILARAAALRPLVGPARRRVAVAHGRLSGRDRDGARRGVGLVCRVRAFVVVSGLGTAAYHPEGTKFAPTSAAPPGEWHVPVLDRREPGRCARGPVGRAADAPPRALGRPAAGAAAVVVTVLLLGTLPYLQGFAPERRAGQTGLGEDRPAPLRSSWAS